MGLEGIVSKRVDRPYRSGRYPTNRLIDPLYLMSLQMRPTKDLGVLIQPFDRHQDYREFRGFTYHLPCR